MDLPDDPEFSATLLISREFMHHLKFDEIRLRRKSEPTGLGANSSQTSQTSQTSQKIIYRFQDKQIEKQ